MTACARGTLPLSNQSLHFKTLFKQKHQTCPLHPTASSKSCSGHVEEFSGHCEVFLGSAAEGEKKRKAKSGVDFRGGTSEDVQTPPQHYDWV